MITSTTADNVFSFNGLSTDTKPKGSQCTDANVEYPIQNGSTFLEMDTSKVYVYSIKDDGTSEWLEL